MVKLQRKEMKKSLILVTKKIWLQRIDWSYSKKVENVSYYVLYYFCLSICWTGFRWLRTGSAEWFF
jgi:hypothetical protein